MIDTKEILGMMPKTNSEEKTLSPIKNEVAETMIRMSVLEALASYLEEYPSEDINFYEVESMEYFHYPKGTTLEEHVDSEYDNGNVRNIGCVLFLNTVENGGELHFPRQQVQVWCRSGNVVFFPAGFTHPHYVATTEEERHSIVVYIHKKGDRGSNY
jgi:hypothetical protein